MEIYELYIIIKAVALFLENKVNPNFIPLYSAVGAGLIFLILFLLQGMGIARMAKNRNVENRWLAFIPFVNLWYVGKLAGECQFFVQKIKRGGVYAMIAQIVATFFTFTIIGAEIYLWSTHGAPKIEVELGSVYWSGLTGFSLRVFQFYDLSVYIAPIAQLICRVFSFVLLASLYRSYAPKYSFALNMLTLFEPVSRFIIVFALRNREAIDYEAYVRKQQEEYFRRRQQYSNPYHNPYGAQWNPYQNGQDPYEKRPPREEEPEEPFAEFSSSTKHKTDDFFS